MCDLLNIDRDTYYDNVKDSIFNKLNQNENQTAAMEEYTNFIIFVLIEY